MLVTLPFVLLLLDYWPLGRAGSGERGAGSGEQGAGSGERGAGSGEPRGDSLVRLRRGENALVPPGYGFVRGDARRPTQRPSALGATGLCRASANAAVAYVAYLGKMLYPADLAVFYPFPAGPSPILEVVAAVSLLSAISAAFFAARRKCPWLLVGWLWYLGTLAPVIGLVQVGGQAMADRYTYLTQIGIYIAIAWGVADAARSWPGRHWLLAAASRWWRPG